MFTTWCIPCLLYPFSPTLSIDTSLEKFNSGKNLTEQLLAIKPPKVHLYGDGKVLRIGRWLILEGESSSLLYVSLVSQDSDLFEGGNKHLVPWESSVYEPSVALSHREEGCRNWWECLQHTNGWKWRTEVVASWAVEDRETMFMDIPLHLCWDHFH